MTIKISLSILILVFLSSCATDKKIEEWVQKNPDKIYAAYMESKKKQESQYRPSPELLNANMNAVFDESAPIHGEGTVKIAYFFDFNCGHCVRQSQTIKQMFNVLPTKTRVYFRPMAVLGPSSELAARASLAAHQQNKFYEFYEEALKIREKNAESLKGIAKKIKMNLKKWESDLNGPVVNAHMNATKDAAQKMNIRGTPFIAIAPDKVFPGRVDQLITIVEAL